MPAHACIPPVDALVEKKKKKTYDRRMMWTAVHARPTGGNKTPTLSAAMTHGSRYYMGGDSSYGTRSNCLPRYSPTRRQTSGQNSAEYDWKWWQPGLCCAPIQEAEVNNNVLPYLWGNNSAPGYHTKQAVTFPLLYLCTCQSVWYGNAPLGLT